MVTDDSAAQDPNLILFEKQKNQTPESSDSVPGNSQQTQDLVVSCDVGPII
jgi:hypothetical protein